MKLFGRPRPVVVFGIVVAVLEAVSESADAANVLPGSVFPWIRLALTLVTAIGGALWAQSKVTPVKDPRDNDGRRLIRAPRQWAGR